MIRKGPSSFMIDDRVDRLSVDCLS